MGEAGFYAPSLARILFHIDALNGISAGAVGCMKSNLAQLYDKYAVKAPRKYMDLMMADLMASR